MKPDVDRRLLPEAREALQRSVAPPPFELPADPILAMRAAYDHERRHWNEPPVPVAAERDIEMRLAGLPARLRLILPTASEPLPVLVYLHGGGWVLGSVETHSRIMRLLAMLSGWAVLGLDYALAPEHRLPVPQDQVAELLARLADVPEIVADRFALAGDSAGAHLALAAAIDRHIAGGAQPLALLLWYGAFGLSDSTSRRLWSSPASGLTVEDMDFFRDAYLGPVGDRQDRRYDLLRAALSGLPPAHIAACVIDPLHDDSIALARLLEAAGGRVDLQSYDGVLHGFLHQSRSVLLAMTALERGAAFLRDLRPGAGSISRP